MEGKLKEAKADRRESERERTMLKAVTNMKQLFTGAVSDPDLHAKADEVSFMLALSILRLNAPCLHAVHTLTAIEV